MLFFIDLAYEYYISYIKALKNYIDTEIGLSDGKFKVLVFNLSFFVHIKQTHLK